MNGRRAVLLRWNWRASLETRGPAGAMAALGHGESEFAAPWGRSAVLLSGAGRGEIKEGDFFRTDGIWQDRLVREGRNAEWGKIFVRDRRFNKGGGHELGWKLL